MHKAQCKKGRGGPASKASGGDSKTPAKGAGQTIPTEIGARFFVDAFLLPVDDIQPKIVKVEYEVMGEYSEYSRPFHMPRFLDKYGLDSGVGRSYVDRQWYNGPPLEGGQALQVYYRDNCLNDGSRVNKCVRHVAGGHPGQARAGNMVVVKLQARSEPNDYVVGTFDPDAVTDVLPEDIKALASWLRNYG